MENSKIRKDKLAILFVAAGAAILIIAIILDVGVYKDTMSEYYYFEYSYIQWFFNGIVTMLTRPAFLIILSIGLIVAGIILKNGAKKGDVDSPVPAVQGASAVPVIEESKDELKELLELGIITEEEYELKKNENASSYVTVSEKSTTESEEMKEYKELLDLGILTEEEFQIKKNELCGIE